MNLIELTESGLYCSRADIYIDPWRPVKRAVVTHAHGDHTRPGSHSYLCSTSGKELVQLRTQPGAKIEAIPYGERLSIHGVSLSFHPAGHILGSSQIRLEYEGYVVVVSGDYKLGFDSTAESFEPVACNHFFTEATFAVPVYRWPSAATVAEEIRSWWAKNREEGKTSVVYAYALGKAQRVLSYLLPAEGPVGVHGAVRAFLGPYHRQKIDLPVTLPATLENAKALKGRGLLIAPPSAMNSSWLKKFHPISESFASGWMQIRGQRRRRGVERGFVLSDHADWQGLLQAIAETGADTVTAMHGNAQLLVRWLQENGKDAQAIETRFQGEPEEAVPIVSEEDE